MTDELFDRPAAMRVAAVDRLGLEGAERVAGLVTGACYPDALVPIADACRGRDGIVLDVGAGLGAASVWLRDAAGVDVVGVEPEGRAALLARRVFPQLPMSCGSADAIPVRAATCVGVVMLGTASLLADLDTALGEAIRVVRADGVIAITDLCLAEAAVQPSGANVFRSADRIAASLASRGCTVTNTWRAPATLSTEWDDITARVDEEIAAREGGTEAFGAWKADREHLHDLIVDGTLEVATVIATAPPR